MTEKNDAVAKKSEFALMTSGDADIESLIRDNVGAGPVNRFDLVNIKVPGAGGVTWEVPTISGDVESMQEIEGIIIHVQINRAFWDQGYDESGGGTPPDCMSEDGFSGLGVIKPGQETGPHECTTCPHNVFGTSAKGGGKACKEMRVMYILREKGLLPYVVSAPPGSLKNMKQYGLGLASEGMKMSHVVTGLKLQKKSNKEGKPYAVITPRMVRPLQKSEAAFVDKYAATFRPQTEVSVNPEDYQG